MKVNKMIGLVYCILLFLFSFTLMAEENTVYFVTDESPPYTINSKDSNLPQGFMIDVAREVFSEAGYKINIRFAPYKRSIQEVYEGNVNGVLLVAENTAPNLIYLKNPIAKDYVVFIAQKGKKWIYTGVQSLDNMRIGSGVGFDFADQEINDYIKRKSEEKSPLIQLISGEDINLRNFQKLVMDRLDIVIATEKIGRYIAQKNNLWDQLEIVGRSKTIIIAQTGFNPNETKNQRYADILSNGVLKLSQTGRLSDIMRKYGLVD